MNNKHVGLANTYCNPLAIPSIPIGRNSFDKNYDGAWWREFGDPSVVKFKGRWYLFPSCAMVWYSGDMINWKKAEININDVGWGPSVAVRGDTLYLTASWEGTRIWKTQDPLGYWEDMGPVVDENGNSFSWADPCLFVDDDQRVYAYFSLGANKGIFGVELSAPEYTTFQDKPTKFFGFEPAHLWERFGECNQNPSISHLEGASMTKANGRYYLQYSAAGAEWKNYAVGCYVSDQPLGPYHYQSRNPILIQKNGMINGCGHNCTVEGPDGKLWCFYTILMRRYRGLERRIGMDPVYFDEDGCMYVDGPSESPRCIDGHYPQDVYPVCQSQPVTASSTATGRDASFAVDNYIRSHWEAEGSCPQEIAVNLQAPYAISAIRLLFNDRPPKDRGAKAVYQYVIESITSDDISTVLIDESASEFDGHIRYHTFAPRIASKIRLRILSVPAGNVPGVIDLSAFGTYSE